MCTKIVKPLLYVFLIILGACSIGICVCNALILHSACGKIYEDISSIPYNNVGVLLGTSKYARNGRPNVFYAARIDACVRLYEAGKIERVLISGDNSHANYDEPTCMKLDLMSRGIPSDIIFLDYAGFRTLDSMVRAKEIFGLNCFTIISQKFHNERALYIADYYGINAIAYNATDVRGGLWKLKMSVREWFARVKAVYDVVIGKEPHFLGEKMYIK